MTSPFFDMTGLPERPTKPRDTGLTLMLDKGLPPGALEDALSVIAPCVDYVKLGWGTSLVTPGLERKLAIYRDVGLPTYLGGTLFEAFHYRGQLDVYRRMLDTLGLEHVEVSDGSINIDHSEKLRCIRLFAQDFEVFSEVGSKDADKIMPPTKWVHSIQAELDAGSRKVICEARESGTAGLYRPNGELRPGLVEEIDELIGQERVIFEAPQKAQQVWLIRLFGANVNLGNISPEEVIPLETLRLGLRGDTLFEFYTPPPDLRANGQEPAQTKSKH